MVDWKAKNEEYDQLLVRRIRERHNEVKDGVGGDVDCLLAVIDRLRAERKELQDELSSVRRRSSSV